MFGYCYYFLSLPPSLDKSLKLFFFFSTGLPPPPPQKRGQEIMENLPAQTLQHRVAIVTGASRGLGAVMALDLAKRGACVTLTYTSASSEERAAAVVRQISELPNSTSATAVRADAAEPSSAEKVVAETLRAFGPHIDILVNNAGVQITKTVADITPADFQAVYAVNVLHPILLTRAVLPYLRAPGRIVNVSSVGGRAGFAQLSLYTSSKAALEGLTRSWAGELGRDGTTVNAVAPGPVQSEMLEKIPPDIVAMQKRDTPVQQRLGRPQEIADVVSWLAGPESSWVSGQVINVSGGWTMY